MVVAAREVPRLRIGDFANVPADGAGDRTAVCGGVSGVRHHADDGEEAVFYVVGPDSVGNRISRNAVSRPCQPGGVSCGGCHFWAFATRPIALRVFLTAPAPNST